ncbi:MAG: hypothetical protein WDW36_009085 [Sanguina aurantia]
MTANVCPTSKVLRVRAPASAVRSTSRCAPPRSLKTLAAKENKVASTVAAGIVAAGLLLAQPVLAAGVVNPDGTASVPKLGDVVNKTFSKLFPAGAFDKALEVAKDKGLGGNASVTDVGESKSVTQLLNEVAEPSPARKSPIARAARKFEPDVDPTYVAKPKKDKGPALAGVESEAPENPTSTAGRSIGNPPPKGTPSSF